MPQISRRQALALGGVAALTPAAMGLAGSEFSPDLTSVRFGAFAPNGRASGWDVIDAADLADGDVAFANGGARLQFGEFVVPRSGSDLASMTVDVQFPRATGAQWSGHVIPSLDLRTGSAP